mmetsp:Transcript_13469/g.17642  ORF Transcript_13469/g.17642 Transcript_13469/m.17642 type:complete len:105 (-) Transcript_13469:8-322(-)
MLSQPKFSSGGRMGSHDASSVTALEGAASVVEKTAEEDTVAADLDTPKEAPPDTVKAVAVPLKRVRAPRAYLENFMVVGVVEEKICCLQGGVRERIDSGFALFT